LRHYADDGKQVVVEPDLFANDRRITCEAALPYAVTEDDYMRAVEPVFCGLKLSAETRRDAEHLKVGCTNALSVESFGLIVCRHRRLPGFHDSDRIEGVASLRQTSKGAEGCVHWCAAALHLPEHHDAAGVRIREWIKQNGFYHAEDCGACANRNAENED